MSDQHDEPRDAVITHLVITASAEAEHPAEMSDEERAHLARGGEQA